MDIDSIWGDEWWSIINAGLETDPPSSPLAVWPSMAASDPFHPPAYFISLNLWGHLVGAEPAILRVLSLIYALLTIAGTYRLAADLTGPLHGLFASLVLAFSSLLIFYAHELRAYTFVTFVVVCILWSYQRLFIRRTPRHASAVWVVLVVSVTVCLYTHYFAAIALVPLGLFHLFFVRKTAHWWRFIGVISLALVAFLPWLRVMLMAFERGNTDPGTGIALLSLLEQVVTITLAYLSNNNTVVILFLLVIGLLAWKRSTWWVGFLIAGDFLLIAGVHALIQPALADNVRYTAAVWPLLALAASIGFGVLWRWRLSGVRAGRGAVVLLLLVWAGTGIWFSTTGFDQGTWLSAANRFPFHRAARLLQPVVQGDELSINFATSPDMPDWMHGRYLAISKIYYDRLPADYTVARAIASETGQQEELTRLQTLTADYQRLWLVSDPSRVADRFTPFVASLQNRFAQCEPLVNDANLRIDQFTLSPICCRESNARPGKLRFGENILLSDVDIRQQNDHLHIVAAWSLAPELPLHEYSISWQLMNAQHEKVAQADYGLEPLIHPCQEIKLAVGDLPAGEYHLMAIAYAWKTGQQLAGVQLATGETGTTLEASRITLS